MCSKRENRNRSAYRQRNRRGVSPIIATILLVAITVVIASVLYVLVSGYLHSSESAPQSVYLSSPVYSGSGTPADPYQVVFTSVTTSPGVSTADFGVKLVDGAGTQIPIAMLLTDVSGNTVATWSDSSVAWSTAVAVPSGASLTLVSGSVRLQGSGDNVDIYGLGSHSVSGGYSDLAMPTHLGMTAVPSVIATGTIYVNQTLPAGYSYATPEYVTINNGTAEKLPLVLTGEASAVWIQVANQTRQVGICVSGTCTSTVVFSNAHVSNTSASANTNTINNTIGWKQPITSQVWVVYTWQNYSVDTFTASGLSAGGLPNTVGNITWTNFDNPTCIPTSSCIKHSEANVSFGPNEVAVIGVPVGYAKTNLSISPLEINSTQTCTNQGCNYTQYNFIEWSGVVPGQSTLTLTSGHTIQFGTASAGVVAFGLVWIHTSVTSETTLGTFFADGNQFVQTAFVQFWYLWLLLIVGLLVYVGARGTGSRGRRRRH